MKVKVYTDASFDVKTNTAACGYVITSEGEVIKHDVVLMGDIPCSQSAECYAVYLALLEVIKFKPTHIEVRCDCDTIIKMWHEKIRSRTLKRVKCLPVLKEIAEGLRASYVFINFRKVKAHNCSQLNNKVDRSVRYHLRNYLRAA